MKPNLVLAMRHIVQQEQRGIKENLFSLGHTDTVLMVLAIVACIPLKANDG